MARSWLCVVVLIGACGGDKEAATSPPPSRPAAKAVEVTSEEFTVDTAGVIAELVAKAGETERARIERGVAQAARFWRAEDGDFAAFAKKNFVRGAELDALFARLEAMFEQVDGRMLELSRELRAPSDLDLGPMLPVDEIFAGWDPAAHLAEDAFTNKLAFVVLLNFPLTTLEEREAAAEGWTRRQWAEARLGQRFNKRVPAEVDVAIAAAGGKAELYINRYNIYMGRVVDAEGRKLFPEKMRLLSHWNLRDEIRASYADATNGLAKQRLIQRIMERIVDQSIPAVVIDNDAVDWDPVANTVGGIAAEREPDTRYATLREQFLAWKKADPYSPTAPTVIARRFDEARELSEERVAGMLKQVLTSPLVPRVATLIEKRLGRKLEPFDLWYAGFSPRGGQDAAALDALTKRRYPDAEAYQRDMPRMLRALGFAPAKADFLAARIVVEPARGSGHAWGAAMRGEKARLRTRVEKDGMNFKGFNIAVHEMGHNVEQVLSLDTIDHTLIRGVPNNAFTEALAFVFQARDLELLGLAAPTAESRAMEALSAFWATYEIAGVALVDIAVWHWMYDNPDHTPEQLREATLKIARDVWNEYYAPVFGQKDSPLLGIYSHMINYPLYLADYPIGHMIAFQIEEQMHEAGKGKLGAEFERMATQGNILPDVWMKRATGAPVGPEALLAATERALAEVQ